MAISSKNNNLRDFIISRVIYFPFLLYQLTEGVSNDSSGDFQMPEKILLEIGKIAVEDEVELASTSLAFVKAFGIFHPNGVQILLQSPALKDIFLTIRIEEQVIRIAEVISS